MIWIAILAFGANDSFVARTVEGKEVRGPLAALSPTGGVQLGKGVRKKVPWSALATLRRAGQKLPELPADDQLILVCGDRVPVRDLRLDDEKLCFKHADLGDASIPLSAVALIWRTMPGRSGNREAIRRRLLAGKRKTDRVVLRNGDSIEGSLSKLGGVVEVEHTGKIRKVRWSQVAAIPLNTELADTASPGGAIARVVVAPGDRSAGGVFTVVSASLEEGEFVGKTIFGTTLRVPLERLASLERIAPDIVPLSSLAPSSYVYFPYLDETARYSVGGTGGGGDLRVGGSVWIQGLSVRAHSQTEWHLGGKYSRFEAMIGLDDQEGRRGKAKVRVIVDGKEAAVHDLASGPVRVKASLKGARSLKLEVLPGGSGPVRAVVDIVDARLTK